MNEKKGQVVIISMSIMLFLFVLVLLFFTESMTSSPLIGDSRSRLLEHEATRLSDSLLLPGFPDDWNASTVQRIGLVSGDALDLSKISNFTNMPYEDSKGYLGVQFEYFVNITYTDEAGDKQTILKNDTSLNDILDNMNFVVSRQRSFLINEEGVLRPATILILSYSK